MKKSETDIIEFEAFALVQGPTNFGEVNGRPKNIRSDMMMLVPSLCCSLSLTASLRTSIPGRGELI